MSDFLNKFNSAALTEEEKAKIRDIWASSVGAPPSIKELIKAIRPHEEIDARTSFGKVIRSYLVELDPNRATKCDTIINNIDLDQNKKDFIESNCSKMNPLAITRIIFNNDKITPFSVECRAVKKYMSTLSARTFYINNEGDSLAADEWIPPNTVVRCIERVNKYLYSNPLPKEKDLPEKKKKDIKALINYLSTMRFSVVISSYESAKDRELFESEFIRCTYDKPDLSEEEVDEYIMYSQEVVNNKNIGRLVSSLQEKLDEHLRSEDSDGKIPMTLVEALGKMKTDWDQSVKRQQELLKNLKGKRAERLSRQIQNNTSVLNLVADWKFEENRRKMIAIAEKRKSAVEDEFKRLDEMEEIKARIFGIDLNTVQNG